MPIKREKRKRGFTVLNNKTIQKNGLSFRATGLLVYLLSMPDDWTVYINQLVKHSPLEGRAAIRTAMKELKDKGYLINLGRVRNSKGLLQENNWLVVENPDSKAKQPKSDYPTLDKPTYDKPTYDNRTLQNTNYTNNLNNKELTKKERAISIAPSLVQLDEEFKSLWSKYPNKKGKKAAFNHYKAWRREKPKPGEPKHTPEFLSKKLDEYLLYIKQKHYTTQYILNGSTWFNGRFMDELDIKRGYQAPKSGGYENYGAANSAVSGGYGNDTPPIDDNDEDLPY